MASVFLYLEKRQLWLQSPPLRQVPCLSLYSRLQPTRCLFLCFLFNFWVIAACTTAGKACARDRQRTWMPGMYLAPWVGPGETWLPGSLSFLTSPARPAWRAPLCTCAVNRVKTLLAWEVQVCDSGCHSRECSGIPRLLAPSLFSPVLSEGETDPIFLVHYNHLVHRGGAQELRIQTPDCSLQFRQELLENAPPNLWSLGLDTELSVPVRVSSSRLARQREETSS